MSRRELFRPGVSENWLERLRQRLLTGIGLPSWIRENEDNNLRKDTIRRLNTTDVFRNQFRTRDNAPQAPLEILEWGLQHISRLRKASLEAREQVIKSWQLRLLIILEIINIVVGILYKQVFLYPCPHLTTSPTTAVQPA